VLITLAIIGVIAAITIPSLIANHKKTTLESQFAKSYKTLTHMANMAIAEHGSFENWDWKETFTEEEYDEFAKKYFTPYLNVAKFCPSDKSNGYCFAEKYNTAFNLSSFSYIPNEFKKPQVILADGSSIIFGIHENCAERTDYCVTIGVDVNGIKKPNTVGRDVFSFNIYPQVNRFMPGGTYKAPYDSETGKFYERSPDEIRELCSEVKRSSWNCAARIIIDGFKMNY